MNKLHISLPEQNLTRNSKTFLMIGVWSLAIAGIFALVLVVARTPGFCDVPYFMKLFHEALVAHVDLSVLVWFLSIACMFWSLSVKANEDCVPYLTKASQICLIAGIIFISIAPFDSTGEGVMSNYIPVIMNPIFFLGLSLILCGTGMMLTNMLFTNRAHGIFPTTISYGIYTSGVIALFSIAAFIWSFKLMPPQIDGQQYYELGFWGGGHVLQFVHTQILLICWLWLAIKLKPEFILNDKFIYSLFSIGLFVALATPLPYLFFEITSPEYRAFFTDSMIFAGGIAPCLLAFFIIPIIWQKRVERKKEERALWASLFMSVLLFMYGGFLATLIQGQNVVIPAHYHGSIVGVTLAFMGVSYLLLPHFGYQKVSSWKLAYWQPIVYGLGQLLHISGLAYSGGYGKLQRKTPCGGGIELAPDIKAAMGLMGGGGMLAIIGGIMFVLVIGKAVYGKPKP